MRKSVAAHHVGLSNYNSSSRTSLQGNSCISLSKFYIRSSLLSILINDKCFKSCCDTDDLSSLFIRFSFENDLPLLQFEHIK